MQATIEKELARRVAAAAAAVEGVRSAIVCGADGAVLGAAGGSEPNREAALASFVAIRAEALPVDGDLRGMGKQLAGSKFAHLAISGFGGETLLYNLGGSAYLSVRIAPGRSTTCSGPLAALVRRVSSLPESSMRSSQP
jgi:predicted regulator of Ras-like GTPase activity (Roadblock/LC7/MglB family)